MNFFHNFRLSACIGLFLSLIVPAHVLSQAAPGPLSSKNNGTGRSSNQETKKLKIIIDTDIGEDIDDILVIAFALNSPEFDVLAITTVDGGVGARSRISRRLTKAFGKSEIPVAAGYVWDMPLADSPITGTGGVTQGDLAPDEKDLPPPSPLRADELIAGLAGKYPGEVYLLVLGSYANIGQFLVRYPEAAGKLKAIVTSGVFMDPGPVTSGEKIPDWNFRYDPLAAAVIMRSEIPWVITPSSMLRHAGGLPRKEVDRLIEEGLVARTTNHAAAIPWEDVDRIRHAGLPSTDLLARAIDLWKKNKPDAADYPTLADLGAFVYVLGGWASTVRGNVYFSVPPRGVLPGVRVEVDPQGRASIAEEVPEDLGPELYKLVIERLLAPPQTREK
ncbi:MAG TPA: nucleoside hydrolase [archaeon]|nr:nucleoside hydrolase [archaeon]